MAIFKGRFPRTVAFYQPWSKAYGAVDGPKYYDLPIPNCKLEMLMDAGMKMTMLSIKIIMMMPLCQKCPLMNNNNIIFQNKNCLTCHI